MDCLMKFNWLDFCSFFGQCWMRFYYGFLVIFFFGGGGIWGCFGLVFFWLVLAVWTVDFCEKLMQRMRRKDNMDFI